MTEKPEKIRSISHRALCDKRNHLKLSGAITEWEYGFLQNVARFDHLSPKQMDVIDRIQKKVNHLPTNAATVAAPAVDGWKMSMDDYDNEIPFQ